VPRAVEFLPPLVQRDTTQRDLLPGALGRYADLGMHVNGYGELGGAWTRFKPCDPSLHLNCNPSLFPQLKPDVQFTVNVAGTISDRIHVNVDYDQTREETLNANVFSVFYEGLPDEILQRLEVGDVQFRLPRSRYLTQSVPAGNFGFMALGQLGPVEFQTIWAQQRGDFTTREFQLQGGGTEGLVQEEQLTLDDADYVSGQFFFLVHPDSLRGAPHVDVLQLRATDATVRLRPEPGGVIELYRDERIPPASGQQQTSLFLANAVSEDGTLRHSGQFRRLDPEQDYLVHPSGLWIMLRRPLGREEALAVSFRTESGDTIGTLGAEQTPAGAPAPVLRLLRSPVASHQPGRPTWDFEMHQIYRMDSSGGVDLASVDLRISLGDIVGGNTFRTNAGRQITFLRLFGLDEDAPVDRIDAAQVLQPEQLFGATTQSGRITGTYIVFPTLEPFRAPPDVRSENLTPAQALALLGADANPVIYESTDPVIRESSGRFRLNLVYRVRVEGLRSQFSVGQIGIREGSERITIGDRRLERGIDYNIDYEFGQVTLTDPQGIFGANPNARVRVTFEQGSLFQVAPTSMFGANLRYGLGARSELNVVGLYQSEKTLYARPQLGTEPASIFLGGLSANLDLGGAWLDRLMANSPMRSTTPSRVTLNAELALSAPNPNRRGQGYAEDFEDTNETSIDVRRQTWRLGSRPESVTGDDGFLPPQPDATNATRLVWQHDIAGEAGGVSGSLVPQRDIDRQINVIGNQLPEPAMWLTFGNREPAGTRVWRSMTTVLNTTGRDMSRDEFFEFYMSVGGNEPLALIFDFGTTAEDGFYVDSAGRTNGVYGDGRRWGLNELDEEARTRDREVWGTTADARGLWDQPCQAEPLKAYALGDERSNCTRGNGVPDTEDLDGNGALDPNDGEYFRYVVRLDQLSPYLARDTTETGTVYRLFRVRLRDGVPVNGATDGTWRSIKHLRMTVVGEPSGVRKNMVLARLRIIGSRWTKRGLTGVVRGVVDEVPGIGANTTVMRTGPISRTVSNHYRPPPNVTDQLQDPSSQFGTAGIEVNEKSQRIEYQNLEPGDRAEIYFRYPQQPRSLMTYRQLRLWALPRAGTWGANGAERLIVKLGTDSRNAYLFQTRLRPAIGGRPAQESDWLPEIVIDFDRWFDLRAIAEAASLRTGGITRDTVWDADSTYAVVLEDRARAANLAAIREFSLAVYNTGGVPISGEVWIDDMRLDRPVQDAGAAANVTLDVQNDAFTAAVNFSSQSPVFRQLNQDATYVGGGELSLSFSPKVDRMLPARWGLDMPVSITHARTVQSPSFLERSDVRASGLTGLRESGAGSTSFGVRMSKRTPSTNALAGLLVDGTTLSFGYDAAHTNTHTSRNTSGGVRGGLEHRRDIAPHDADIVPGFLESVLRAIAPAAIERSEFFGRLTNARLRYTPARIGFGANYSHANASAYRFTSILEDTSDFRLAPIESPRRAFDNTADIAFEPFESVSAGLTVRSVRDLLEPERATPLVSAQQALREARASVAGADIGWETSRSMNSTLALRPTIASWIRPSWTFSNRFLTDRDPSYIEIDESSGDSIALLQRRFGSDRQITRRLDVQPALLARSLQPDSLDGAARTVVRLLGAVQQVTLTWNSQVGSSFDRETFAPGLGYQLGLGGFDGFRAIGGDTAATAVDRDDVRAGTIVSLPLGAQFALNYAESQNDGFDIRGGQREQRQRSWPNVGLTWGQIPVPAFLAGAVLSASLSTRYEEIDRSAVYGLRSPQLRGLNERRITPELRITVAGGLTFAWNSTISRGTTLDPTGNGEQDGTNHMLTVSGSIPPPAFLSDKMKTPMRALLTFTQDDQRRCRFRPAATAGDACVSFIDTSNRTVNFNLDTTLSDIEVGMRLNYTDRQSRVGTRTGSSQFQFALFGRFDFQQGQIPGR